MRNVLAGLWSRRGLNLATLALAVVAVAVAMTGPLYATASVEHLLDSRMEERPPATLGLTATTPALPPGSLPTGSPDEYTAPDPDTLLAAVSDQVDAETVATYWQQPHPWLLDEGGVFTRGELTFRTALYWREDMCTLARVRGRCPAAADEALMDATMAETLGLTTGDAFELDFTERWLAETRVDGAPAVVERSRSVPRTFILVGTYRVPDPDDPAWFQPARFQGDGLLRPPPEGSEPTAPALLVDPAAMTSQSFVAGADRPIDPTTVDVDTMADAAAALAVYQAQVITDETSADFDQVDLAGLVAEVEGEQTLLSRVTLAAAVPLVVLALLLLHGLVAAAAEVRRPQVALAKLRGFSPRQVTRFALTEPFLVVLAAVPPAMVAASAGTQLLAGTWLAASAPVRLTPTAVGAAAAVTVVALLAATAAVVGIVREPLATALASPTRKPGTSRWGLVARSAVVMLAVAAVVQVWSSRGGESTTVLELLAPLFIGLAAGVGGIYVLGLLARGWVARTRRRGVVAAYLSSRRLLRRQDLGRLMVPLLLSVSVTTFAVSAWETADDWRVSTARATVGAPTAYLTDADPGRLLAVTHDVDPEGRYLAAAVVDAEGSEEAGRVVLVDSPRFARVAAWDDSWSDSLSAAEVQALLEPGPTGVEPLTFAGQRLSLRLSDVALEATLHEPLELWVRYTRGDTGAQSLARLGRMPIAGAGEVRGLVSGCAVPCRLEQVYLTGASASITDAQGAFTIAAASTDGDEPLAWPFTDPQAWRPARPFPAGLTEAPVDLTATARGLKVAVRMGGRSPGGGTTSGIARIAPTDVAEVAPVVVTTGTSTEPLTGVADGLGAGEDGKVVGGSSLLGVDTPMRRVAETRALPVVGDEGAVSDLSVALREYGEAAGTVTGTQLWVAQGAPARVIDEVRAAGVTLTGERTVAGELEELRNDAFSLGWRVFLLVGVLAVVLAVLGILAGAVISNRWRAYEVAALRVVGVSRRSLVRASVLEYLALLGAAVVLGAASAVVALWVVLPSIDIGEVGEYDPFVDYAIRWPVVGGTAALVLAGVLLVALLVSVRTAGLGRASSLRQGERP